MREIKFRGFRTVQKDWVYGNLTVDENGTKYIVDNKLFSEDGHHLVYTIYAQTDEPVFINQDTVGQYTGVHDRNGKEVYEDDIVVTYLKRKYVITWIDKYARFAFWKPDIDFASGLYDYGQFEVIGNIHENPELLGVAHDEH